MERKNLYLVIVLLLALVGLSLLVTVVYRKAALKRLCDFDQVVVVLGPSRSR